MRCCTVCSCGAWIGLLGVGLLCIGLAAGAEAAGRGAGGRGRIQPAVLRCEYAHNPLGIDVRQPRLSWILEAGSRAVRGEEQTAYQVLVGTDEARLRANRPDLWNSGKVLGRNSVHVPYSGKPLRAGVRAFWKVRVWDRQGNPSEFSPLAWWEMGLLEPRDWRATWITRGDAPPASDRELFEENPAPLFRRELNLTKSVARARAYVSGLGYYELRINGARVGDQVLDPGWTTYSRRVLYSTYDVTSLLRRGRNALGTFYALALLTALFAGGAWLVGANGGAPPVEIPLVQFAFWLPLGSAAAAVGGAARRRAARVSRRWSLR